MTHPTLVDLASRTKAMAGKKWIKSAIKPENRGKFREKAERAGKTTRAFAREHAGDSGTLGKEARLAETLMGMKRRSKRDRLYDNERSSRRG